MAYEALYRRYRPGRFADVTGQRHVMQALRNAVAHDRVGHAYMFSGPRGTGKTTSARILAKALNCTNRAPGDGEPCDTCPSCLSFQAGTSYDLRELDAASNNGVEAMRDLISKVGLSAGGHGVFILDEAHMLSTGAENALLKTLEEPPPNVTFILCTTEPNKVVPTIRSRTQHFDFSLLSGDELDGLVREVLAADGVELADQDIDYVVRAGKGSARDTLSALDQVIAAGGAPEAASHGEALLGALAENNTADVLVATHEALKSGRDPELVGRDLLSDLRNAFLATMRADLSHMSETDRAGAIRWSEAFSPAAITRAVELLGAALVSMRQAPDPRVDLEVALVRLTRPELDTDPAALVSRIERLEAGGVAVAPGAQVASPPSSVPLDATPPPSSDEDRPPVATHDSSDRDPSPSAQSSAPAPSAPSEPAPAPQPSAPSEPAPAPQPSAPSEPAPGPTSQASSAAGASGASPASKRPADAARQTLRKVKGETSGSNTPAVPADAGKKQTLGSMRGTATSPNPAAPEAPRPRANEASPPPAAAPTSPAEPGQSSRSESGPPASNASGSPHANQPGPPHGGEPGPSRSSEPGPSHSGEPGPSRSSEPEPPPVVEPERLDSPPEPSPPNAAAPAGVDRAAAEAAWEDGLLDSLPGNVKARFSAAMFVDGPPGSVYIALPNDIHRQRCEDVRQPVDDAFAQRFGQPVPLTLVTEGSSAPAPGGDFSTPPPPAGAATPPTPQHRTPPQDPTPPQDRTPPEEPMPPEDPIPPGSASMHPPGSASMQSSPPSAASAAVQGPEVEVPPSAPSATYDSSTDPYPEEAIDLDALTDATNVSSSVIDRITEAFPGTELLDQEGEPT